MTEASTDFRRLQLLRLTSPTLPVGAFTGSDALEYAVEANWVHDEGSAEAWIGGRLRRSLPTLDVPLLRRFVTAWDRSSPEQLSNWSAFLRASRESAELWEQDNAVGKALARLLASLGCSEAEGWIHHPAANYPCSYALAAHHWGIPLEAAAEGFVYAWCENQVAAAVKLVPLGQTAGQRLLGRLLEDIPACVETGLALEDGEIGSSEPGLAIASALHETQYARLFRA